MISEQVMPSPARVLHIITGLGAGGAEMMLYKLLSAMDRDRYAAMVISLTDEGSMASRIRSLGVPVHALGMKRGIPNPWIGLRLVGMMRREKIQLVQCWMYHADLLGGLAARIAGVPVIWGLRQSNLARELNRCTTLWTVKACARLSALVPCRIVCGSNAAWRAHVEQGYAASKMVLIPNGFDMDIFRPDKEARALARASLGLKDQETPLIGLVARFDPQKDHANFIAAAGLLHMRMPEARFVMCGDGVVWSNSLLTEKIEAAGIRNRFHLLGQRDDVPEILSALDVACSSSCGEGFANVIGEAMACCVPCVVTDVGDSAVVVGDTGRVVPARNPGALAAGLYELLSMPVEDRRRMGDAARRRIATNFSLSAVAARYASLYAEVLAQ